MLPGEGEERARIRAVDQCPCPGGSEGVVESEDGRGEWRFEWSVGEWRCRMEVEAGRREGDVSERVEGAWESGGRRRE